MVTAVRITRMCWSVFVVVATIMPLVHTDVSGFLDLRLDDLVTHVLYRVLGVSPRAEDACDVLDVLPST